MLSSGGTRLLLLLPEGELQLGVLLLLLLQEDGAGARSDGFACARNGGKTPAPKLVHRTGRMKFRVTVGVTNRMRRSERHKKRNGGNISAGGPKWTGPGATSGGLSARTPGAPSGESASAAGFGTDGRDPRPRPNPRRGGASSLGRGTHTHPAPSTPTTVTAIPSNALWLTLMHAGNTC